MAEDQFERYYAEKLWESIPAIYRHEDGIAEEPGVLRAIVQVIAQQAAILRRSQDRLWDDQFIELCDEWAVPYIGDLVATRLLSALNKRGRRIDVAKTIYYRRRKGTPRVLEELITDISGWDGKLVEQFTRLGRARHGLDERPRSLAGRYSGTLPGGWADLRNPRISELSNGPFEEYFHTPDVRRHRGLNGRYAIPKLAFYLYRLKAFGVINSSPFALGDGVRFTFDPSGRDIPLFSKRLRSDDWDSWSSALEWELPAPIPCRLLGHAEYEIAGSIIQQLIDNGLSAAAADELRQLSPYRFKNESSLVTILQTFANSAELLDPGHFLRLLNLALVTDCGKQALLPNATPFTGDPLETSSIVVGIRTSAITIVSAENIASANLASWSANTNKQLTIDAENGRFQFAAPPEGEGDVFVAYHYGFAGTIGAGTYDRPWVKRSLPDGVKTGGGTINPADLMDDGVVQIDDSKTYGTVPDVLNVVDLTLQAGNLQRPYLRLESDWVFDSGPNEDSRLVLDGLWIGSAGGATLSLILRGNFECVIIRNCTLDPGGADNAAGEALLPLALSIEGFIENLCIESSITGPIVLQSAGSIEELSVSNSIIQSVDPTVPAIELHQGKAILSAVTAFGSLDVHRLEASEVIVTGISDVTDTQSGCFRFSAAPAASRLPRPYESFLFTNDANHWFTSRAFGHPGFAQLSDIVPASVTRGAENGAEMGAFASLMNPIKLDGLQAKIDEYMPFGLIPIFINKT